MLYEELVIRELTGKCVSDEAVRDAKILWEQVRKLVILHEKMRVTT